VNLYTEAQFMPNSKDKEFWFTIAEFVTPFIAKKICYLLTGF
jgi:hypothetical protein